MSVDIAGLFLCGFLPTVGIILIPKKESFQAFLATVATTLGLWMLHATIYRTLGVQCAASAFILHMFLLMAAIMELADRTNKAEIAERLKIPVTDTRIALAVNILTVDGVRSCNTPEELDALLARAQQRRADDELIRTKLRI